MGRPVDKPEVPGSYGACFTRRCVMIAFCAALVISILWVPAAVTVIAIRALHSLFYCPERFRETVKDPGKDFSDMTGIPWPPNATVVLVDDSHGGFHGDGEFYIVADVSSETLLRWLEMEPPWGVRAWKRGPVPHEIAFHSELEADLSSPTIWYAARERGAGSIRWHNGDVLAFDPERGRLWVTAWDF